MKPANLPEKLIWFYIIGTYPIYYMGGLYLFAPLLAIFLTIYLVRQWWYQTDETPEQDKINLSSPAYVWLVCMTIIALAIVVGGIDFGIEPLKLFFTIVNRWFKTWGLVALFPLIGHLNIRPQLIYRAICIFCIQSLILVLIFVVLFNLFDSYRYSYVSPLSIFGGGSLFYSVRPFGAMLDVSEHRLVMFAPWPPALGLVGNIFFCLCTQESNQKLRLFGMAGAAALVISSVSRAAVICLPMIPLSIWFASYYAKPWIQFILAGGLFGGAIFSFELKTWIDDFALAVRQYRSGSTKARDAIQQLALDAWHEAPIWGHGGFSESGPASVSFLGIGSHHTWYGLLYASGLMGAMPLGIGFLWSFFNLLSKLTFSKYASVGISILLVLLVFTFVDNIDGSSYLYWPGLVVLGIAFKDSPSFHQSNQVKTDSH